MWLRQQLPPAALLAALIALAGCGGNGVEATTGGGAAQFRVKGGDNSVQEYGTEAPESELRQAAAALHGFLDALARRNWAAACTYLSAGTRQSSAQAAGGGVQGCATGLAVITGRIGTATLREAAVADVGSLRVQGDTGFLLYRGVPKGTIYAISVTREGARWKVASVSGLPLN
jgi:hypothetical protein